MHLMVLGSALLQLISQKLPLPLMESDLSPIVEK